MTMMAKTTNKMIRIRILMIKSRNITIMVGSQIAKKRKNHIKVE